MHFAHQHHGNGSQVTKFALVAGLHALVAFGVINMTNFKVFSPPAEPPVVNLLPSKPVEPPKPVDPPPQLQQVAPPTLVVPQIDIDVTPPPVENPVHATTETQPQPEVQTVAPQVVAEPLVKKVTSGAAMRSAVLADANSCAKPNYPAAAARNGDSGTVVLALLVGTNGRVSDARVTRSSGHRDLDRAAVNALSLCQFKPAMNDGVPEAGWAQIAYVWSLEE
jgi:periplasmic protein TonB